MSILLSTAGVINLNAIESIRKYWRVYISSTHNGGAPALSTVQFKDTNGNILSTGGTAFASSVYTPGSFAAENAFDGNAATIWGAAAAPPQWIAYNFPEEVSINSVVIQHRDDKYWASGQPKNISIQSSDDAVEWFEEWSVSDIIPMERAQVLTFDRPQMGEGSHRYWRILTTSNPSSFYDLYLFQLGELSFNGAKANGGTPIASTTSEDMPASGLSRAFDGIFTESGVSNCWTTSTSPTVAGEWIGYIFATPIKVTSVSVTARQHPNIAPAWTPRNIDIQYSDDGITWYTEWQVTSNPTYYSAQTRTFVKP